MNLHEGFWFFEKALNKKLCEEIIKFGDSKEPVQAGIGEENEVNFNVLKKRNSKVSWLNEPWIYNEILPYIKTANTNAGWNFQWDWSENIQFTKYGKNQFYNWHCDSFKKPYERPEDLNFHGKIRKLSATVNLTDPKEYSGGDFQFDFRNYNPEERNKKSITNVKKAKAQGTIIVFPSHVWHRVTPVTKGNRYSLVSWCLGYPFI
jgi:PKHD-type hydroxylase